MHTDSQTGRCKSQSAVFREALGSASFASTARQKKWTKCTAGMEGEGRAESDIEPSCLS